MGRNDVILFLCGKKKCFVSATRWSLCLVSYLLLHNVLRSLGFLLWDSSVLYDLAIFVDCMEMLTRLGVMQIHQG